MNPCRGVVNNFSIVKIIRILRSCETKCSERNSIIDYTAIGINLPAGRQGGQSLSRDIGKLYLRLKHGTGETSFVVLRKNGITPNGQAKEYQYTEGVAD